jgi:Protein of unknown function (DUF2844)
MPTRFHLSRTRRRSLLVAVSVLALAADLAPTARAALGDRVESVAPDAMQFRAQARVSAGPAFTVHELHTPTGTVIREFVAASGQVFAVSWRGPFKPDLRSLLGNHYLRYASAPRTAGSTRNRLLIDQPDLVVHSGGHMRYYSGLAYLPQQLPAGVTGEQLP